MDTNVMLKRLRLRNQKYRAFLMLLIGVLVFKFYVWSYVDDECNVSYFRQLVDGECVYVNTTIKTEARYVNTKLWKTDLPKPILTLFTTFNIEMQQRIVYENTLKNWKRLKNVETLLFYGDEETKDMGELFNWTVLPVPKYACGTPVLRSMFEVAQNQFDSHFYGYANADLLLSPDFIRTLEHVLRSKGFDQGPVFITGRRIDVNVSALVNKNVHSEDEFVEMAKHGNLSHDMAADYFISNKLFLWKYIPDLVVGRPIIDNWLVWYSRMTNSKIIDSTFTALALHQRANGFVKKVNFCNHKIAKNAGMLPRIPIWRGSVECSTHSALKTSNNEIVFLPKFPLMENCNWRQIIYNK